MTQCHRCKIYLYDTIPRCVKKELEMFDDYRQGYLYKVLPEFIDWILKVYTSIEYTRFCECYAYGRMFARKGKTPEENEYLLNLCIYYQMKRLTSLLTEDVKHIHILLTESGVLRSKRSALYDELPEKYLGLILPKLYLELHQLHQDHLDSSKFHKMGAVAVATGAGTGAGVETKDEDLYI